MQHVSQFEDVSQFEGEFGGTVLGALVIQTFTTTIYTVGVPPETTLVSKAVVLDAASTPRGGPCPTPSPSLGPISPATLVVRRSVGRRALTLGPCAVLGW
ncbi:hypothetical protein [Nocardia sp. CA-119907]|uniref:hypothetical protein n=1 Tax=Nocardia sp. CA-119907 TaxID=3239973 RepID=UPI003D96110D